MTTSPRVAAFEIPRPSAENWDSLLARCLVSGEKLFDAATLIAALYAADALRRWLISDAAPWQSPTAQYGFASAFALLYIVLLERHGGYRRCLSLLGIRETERVLRVTLQTISVALVAAYFLHAGVPRITIGLAGLLVPLFLTAEKWQLNRWLLTLRSKGHGVRRAIIVGTGSTARRLYTALVTSPKLGIDPVAFVEEGPTDTTEIYECSYRRRHCARVVAGPLTPEMCRQLGASVVVVAEPALEHDTIAQACGEVEQRDIETYFTTEDAGDARSWLDHTEIDGIMLARVAHESPRVLYEVGKHALDVSIAALVLLGSAALTLIVGVLVKTTSPGPVFFRQERVGKRGRLFTMYKFRTMYQEAPQYGYSPGQVDDPRVTPLGRFLRRASLDEIPQMVNVLLGQMSLVGPRPEMPFIARNYTPLQRQRLAVKPGVTGLWQISGDRAYLIHENIECDLYYLTNNPAFVWNVLLQFLALRYFEVDSALTGAEVNRS
jgi:exopolysaccharide biosynthesis polyprenyl glycosylphosphotransferase